jgi:hypothetical protein
VSDQTSERAAAQRCASLLVGITTALGEPGSTLFDDLPRLVAEQRARVAELEFEREESRADAGRAHGNAGAQLARVTELKAQVAARDARIAELEAFVGDIACHGLRADLNPTMNFSGDTDHMYSQWTSYLRRINTGLRDAARTLVPNADRPYSEGRPISEEPSLLGYVVVSKNPDAKRFRPAGMVHAELAGAQNWREYLQGPSDRVPWRHDATYVIAEVREVQQ